MTPRSDLKRNLLKGVFQGNKRAKTSATTVATRTMHENPVVNVLQQIAHEATRRQDLYHAILNDTQKHIKDLDRAQQEASFASANLQLEMIKRMAEEAQINAENTAQQNLNLFNSLQRNSQQQQNVQLSNLERAFNFMAEVNLTNELFDPEHVRIFQRIQDYYSKKPQSAYLELSDAEKEQESLSDYDKMRPIYERHLKQLLKEEEEKKKKSSHGLSYLQEKGILPSFTTPFDVLKCWWKLEKAKPTLTSPRLTTNKKRKAED